MINLCLGFVTLYSINLKPNSYNTQSRPGACAHDRRNNSQQQALLLPEPTGPIRPRTRQLSRINCAAVFDGVYEISNLLGAEVMWSPAEYLI